jgi:hypothetical protein
MIAGRYKGIENDAWSWFLPNFIPTISLIAAAFFSDIKKSGEKEQKVNAAYFRFTFYISLGYFIIFSIVLYSYSRDKGLIIAYYRSFSLIFGIIQSLISVSLGAFFIKRK